MSNYIVTTNFAAKDLLASGTPTKAVKGAEITAELNNIATMSTTKVDSLSNAALLSVILSGSSVPANGIYLPSANTVRIATASADRLSVSATAIQGYGPTAGALQDMTPDSGSFSSTTSGAFVATFTWKWRRIGGIVYLWTDAGSGAQTATLNQLTLNSLPSAIQPAATRYAIGGEVTAFSGGSWNCIAVATLAASASWTISPLITPNASNPMVLRDAQLWNASGAGGAAILPGCLFTYPL